MPGLYSQDKQPAKPATDHDLTALRLELWSRFNEVNEALQLLEREQNDLALKFDLLFAILAGDA